MDIKSKILIVEDEERILNFICTVLNANDYETVTAKTGKEALTMSSSHCPDLVILDLGLPDMDGLEIIKFARSWTQMPIIVVSAHMQERDKIKALDAGADDYITKPFGTGELLARIRTALRHFRLHSSNDDVARKGIYKTGKLVIDYNKMQVLINDENVHLTQNEFKIVALLGMHPGRVLTYDYILKKLWGPVNDGNNQVLRVHMANIRRKIEENPAQPKYIFTETGVGYRIAEEN